MTAPKSARFNFSISQGRDAGFPYKPNPSFSEILLYVTLTCASPATGGREAARATGLPCKPDDRPGCQVQAAVM